MENSFGNRMAAFLEDLDALSRRHGVWIRSPHPGVPPVLAEGDGSEAGYRAAVTGDGLAVSFDRTYDMREAVARASTRDERSRQWVGETRTAMDRLGDHVEEEGIP